MTITPLNTRRVPTGKELKDLAHQRAAQTGERLSVARRKLQDQGYEARARAILEKSGAPPPAEGEPQISDEALSKIPLTGSFFKRAVQNRMLLTGESWSTASGRMRLTIVAAKQRMGL